MTSCQQIHETIDESAAGTITPADARVLEEHLRQCRHCARRLHWQQRVAGELARQEIPPASADFESRVLAAATTGNTGPHRRWTTPVLGGAIAAALVLGLVLGVGFDAGKESQPGRMDTAQPASEEATTTEAREQTVRLAFHAGSQLNDVSLTLELPAHVELDRFPGHRQLTWQVDLKPGENIIALPLRIAFPQGGEIVAHLDAGDKRKTFRAPIPGIGEAEQEPSS